jgi:hypothetical protein
MAFQVLGFVVWGVVAVFGAWLLVMERVPEVANSGAGTAGLLNGAAALQELGATGPGR